QLTFGERTGGDRLRADEWCPLAHRRRLPWTSDNARRCNYRRPHSGNASPVALSRSSFSDGHPHAVADLRTIGGLAELEAGREDLPRYQVAVRPRPVGPLGGHRHHHADAIGHVEP